jgi:hypothetical protein
MQLLGCEDLWLTHNHPASFHDPDAAVDVAGHDYKGIAVRHAMTTELVDLMSGLPATTLQTSPHFLLPVSDEVRRQLHVLPPVPDQATRDAFLPRELPQHPLLRIGREEEVPAVPVP